MHVINDSKVIRCIYKENYLHFYIEQIFTIILSFDIQNILKFSLSSNRLCSTFWSDGKLEDIALWSELRAMIRIKQKRNEENQTFYFSNSHLLGFDQFKQATLCIYHTSLYSVCIYALFFIYIFLLCFLKRNYDSTIFTNVIALFI